MSRYSAFKWAFVPVVAVIAYFLAIPLSVAVTGLIGGLIGGEEWAEPSFVRLNAQFWSAFAAVFFAVWLAPYQQRRVGLVGIAAFALFWLWSLGAVVGRGGDIISAVLATVAQTLGASLGAYLKQPEGRIG